MIRNTTTAAQKALRFLFAGLCGTSLLLQAIAVLTAFTPQTNYFQSGAPLPVLAIIAALLAAVCGTADAFLTVAARAVKPIRARITYLPAAVGFLASALELLIFESSIYAKMAAVFSLLAVIYFVTPLLGDRIPELCKGLLGFMAAIGCALLTIYHYFDFTVEMNAPLKLSLQVALLCAMLFFTGEVKLHFGHPASKIYHAVTAWTVAAGAFTAIPTILAFITSKTDRIDYLFNAIALLGITATAALAWINTTNAPARANGDADTTI